MTQDDDTLSAASAGSMANRQTKHDGSPEPTAHLPNTVHAGSRSRESDAGTGDIVEQRWIPVTERLPPGGVRVLIWCGPGTFVDFATLDWKYGWHYDDYGSPEPTHWMPLPAPPTDGK